MKVYSGEDFKLPEYQVSGSEVRIHWDAELVEFDDMDGGTRKQWVQYEALCSVDDSYERLYAKIMQASKVMPEADQVGFSARAKQLVDNWLQIKEGM